jgi:hypothetical protein
MIGYFMKIVDNILYRADADLTTGRDRLGLAPGNG